MIPPRATPPRSIPSPSLVLGLAAVLAAGSAFSALDAEGQVPSRRSAEEGFVGGEGSANFMLAARFAPYNIEDMIHSTTVDPQWIEGTEKFWYQWENADGSWYYIVDPEAGSKRLIFDRDVLAAELTRITRDPWDGKHLEIEKIRFVGDDLLQFDVESSQDEEAEGQDGVDEDEQEDEEREESRPDKKVYHFEYQISTQTLRELPDYEAPDEHPDWASVSPDGEWVVYAREHNLFMMSGADYARVLDARRGIDDEDDAEEAEEEVDVNEVQLTEDGEPYYSWMARSSGLCGRPGSPWSWRATGKCSPRRNFHDWNSSSPWCGRPCNASGRSGGVATAMLTRIRTSTVG
ncbi:MAG: hypothetical protein P8X98_07140 [Woeseiaceae bacterium]